MAVYLITYDLNKEARRPPIVERIKKQWKKHVRLSESSYAIASTQLTSDVFESLKDLIDGNDELLVIPMHQPYAAQTYETTFEWLDEHLPEV